MAATGTAPGWVAAGAREEERRAWCVSGNLADATYAKAGRHLVVARAAPGSGGWGTATAGGHDRPLVGRAWLLDLQKSVVLWNRSRTV